MWDVDGNQNLDSEQEIRLQKMATLSVYVHQNDGPIRNGTPRNSLLTMLTKVNLEQLYLAGRLSNRHGLFYVLFHDLLCVFFVHRLIFSVGKQNMDN